MDPIYWAAILLILGIVALTSVVAALVLAFRHGPWTGLAFMAVAVVGLPTGIATALRYWPRTPMGKRLLLDIPKADEVLPDTIGRRRLKSLVGKIGVAQSLMMPSGAVEIAGDVIDAVSAGMSIEPGQRVRVVEVHGNRVVVQATTEEPATAEANDPLSQPIESLGLDPFDDPLS
jgi:membrane-bound serine protease (ClpP class)